MTTKCYIIRRPGHRSRGMYWLPNGEGYTNDIEQAGLFPADGEHVRRVCEKNYDNPFRTSDPVVAEVNAQVKT